MNLSKLTDKWWAFPLATISGTIGLYGFFWVSTPALRTSYIRREAIEPVVHEWTAGSLKIIDIRTGTEINRIIIGPENQMIAERLYINWEGEQEIRRIGGR